MHYPDEAKQGELAGAIGNVFNSISNGTMPMSVQGLWSRTRSVLLPKPSSPGAIRPIGIKDVWYRCYTRIITSCKAADVGAILKKEGQLAVGLSGGCEIGARIGQLCAMQAIQTAGTDEEACVIGVDCANCFNEIPLSTALEQMRVMAPELVRPFIYMYGQPSDLFGPEGVHVGTREIGTAQGCPLAMMVACMALVPVNREIKSILEDEEVRSFEANVDREGISVEELSRRREGVRSVQWSYADDLNISGRVKVIAVAWLRLGAVYERYGLRLVPHKSTGFYPHIEDDHCFEGMRRSNEGMVCLGSPIGTEEYRHEFVRETLGNMEPDYRTLALLPIRYALLLLIFCYNARPEYLKRAVDPHITHVILQSFDDSVDRCLRKLLGEDPIAGERIRDLRGVKGVGLGIRRHFGLTAEIGARKSMVIAQRFVTDYVPQLLPVLLVEGAWPRITIGEMDGIDMPAEVRDNFAQDDPSLVATGSRGAHQEVSRLAFERLKSELVAQGDTGKSALAWLQSVYSVGGVPFWQSLEGLERGDYYFPSAHFRSMLRFRLFAPFLDVSGRLITRCRRCEAEGGVDEMNIEQWYTHGMGCRWASNFTLRHNAVRDKLEDFLKRYTERDESGRPTITKETMVHEGVDGAPDVVMDLVYRESRGDQRVYFVDVAVVDPGCPTYVARNSHEQQGAAAAVREADKVNSFRQRCGEAHQDPSTLFYPFVIESSGRMGERARRFLRDVVRARDSHIRQLENLSVCCLLDMGVDPSTVSPKQAGQAVITLGEGRDKLEQRLLSYLHFL